MHTVVESSRPQFVVGETRTMFGLVKEPRILLGIGLMVFGTVIGGIVMQRASARVSIWQIDHTVAAGTVLAAGDVHIAEVAGDVAAYVDAGSSIVGRTLAVPLTTGAFVPRDAFVTTAPPLDSVMVPASSLHMPDALRRGELVDVWVSTEDPAMTIRILKRVRVVSTIAADVGGGRGVELAVPPRETAAIVSAMHRGELDLVRVPS